MHTAARVDNLGGLGGHFVTQDGRPCGRSPTRRIDGQTGVTRHDGRDEQPCDVRQLSVFKLRVTSITSKGVLSGT